ncbi:hypothetical protein FALB51S_02650 [Frigidibacter albus]
MTIAAPVAGLRAALIFALALAGCTPAAPPVAAPASYDSAEPLPPMRQFGATQPLPALRPNAQIARDFLELSFQMESGRPLPVLTRFEGPVTLHVTGAVPPTARTDIDRLAARLRAEARIPLRVAEGPPPAAGNAIVVEFLPRAQMQALVPEAACFVVPRIGSWDEYRAARRSARLDWATLTVRQRAAVFIPSDTSPQEIRDCLHEEVAQALGPLNDIYRLPDSVFNDDNFHAILTGFDMLVLRLYYAPELANGMTRAEVAARLPALLARVNPGGGSAAQSAPADPTPRAWIDAVERALGPRASEAARRDAARRAVAIAQASGWSDGRAGFSWFALGRLSLSGDLGTAFTAFLRAALIYRARPGMEIQAAHVDMQAGRLRAVGGAGRGYADLRRPILAGGGAGRECGAAGDADAAAGRGAGAAGAQLRGAGGAAGRDGLGALWLWPGAGGAAPRGRDCGAVAAGAGRCRGAVGARRNRAQEKELTA